ncbi:MAG: D-alanyl-D-alanine carboxypeptidase [Oscillospiraceae bacterium]|nr:D-alanyl-D-alanine carboxypeptidase [Oscillospiraceae bacterium]
MSKKNLVKLLCWILFFPLFIFDSSKFKKSSFTANVNITSESAILVNVDNGFREVFGKNSDKRMFPASTTKIMTFMIVVENWNDLNAKVKVPKGILRQLEGTDSSVVGIKENDVFTVKKLLEFMIVASGNDAALVLADHLGNIDSFVQKMNEKAYELGCEDTHFVNVHGLHEDNHYTTARDLAKILNFATANPLFQEIVKKTEVCLRDEDKTTSIPTTNIIIDKTRSSGQYYPYATGGKTGYTDEAGKCLATSAEKNGEKYICVVLGDKSRERKCVSETIDLFEWAFNYLGWIEVVDKKQLIGEVKVNYASKQDRLGLVPAESVRCLLPKTLNKESINIKIDEIDAVDAPIKAGERIGSATLSYANQVIATVDVVAMTTIEQSKFIYIGFRIRDFISSPLFIILSSISTIILGIYITVNILYQRKRTIKRNNIKKYRKYKKRT